MTLAAGISGNCYAGGNEEMESLHIAATAHQQRQNVENVQSLEACCLAKEAIRHGNQYSKMLDLADRLKNLWQNQASDTRAFDDDDDDDDDDEEEGDVVGEASQWQQQVVNWCQEWQRRIAGSEKKAMAGNLGEKERQFPSET